MADSERNIPAPTRISDEQVAQVMLKHYGFVFRQARRFVVLPDLAEDVVQQVFVEILDKPGEIDLQRDIRPLLFVVTRRVAQRIWHEKSKLMPEHLREIVLWMQNRTPDEDQNHDIRLELLKSCIQHLPETGKKLITDYYFNEVPLQTLAVQLQKKTNTISQAICRLRERLRDCIERRRRGNSFD